MLESMLDRKELGRKWSITKEHIIQVAKVKAKADFTRRDVAKIVRKLPYRFLMKTPSGYCFPASAKEWSDYATWKEKQARGLLHEAIDEGSFNYNDFIKSLRNEKHNRCRG